MIEFQGIGKSYDGVPVIEGLNLTIERGEFVVVIGPSGSGKSTLLKMINRMEAHDAGRILFKGEEIYKFKVRDLRLRMGYAIQSVGLFPHWTVARNIATVPQMLGWSRQKIDARVTELLTLFQHKGEVPRTMNELVELPGVGRKTANVILGNAYDTNEGVVVDTHVGRVSLRLGLTTETDPVKAEQQLMQLFPRKNWAMLSHLFIFHGRRICVARVPKCEICPLNNICPSSRV